jgi:hypothetical protein
MCVSRVCSVLEQCCSARGVLVSGVGCMQNVATTYNSRGVSGSERVFEAKLAAV